MTRIRRQNNREAVIKGAPLGENGEKQMNRHLNRAIAVAMMGSLLSVQAHASWFSDLTGVNIDPWHGKFEIGPPQPGRAFSSSQARSRDFLKTLQT